MTDLIKRDDALAAIDMALNNATGDLFDCHAAIRAMPAIDPAAIREAALQARIEELGGSLAWYQKMDAMCSDHVVELTEKLEAAETKLTRAMAFIRRHIPDSVYEQRQRANAFLAKLEKKVKTPEVLYGSIGEAFSSGVLWRHPKPTHKITYAVGQDGNVLFCKMEELK